MEKIQKIFPPKNAHTANTKSNLLAQLSLCNRLYATKNKIIILADLQTTDNTFNIINAKWIIKDVFYIFLLLLSLLKLLKGKRNP